MTPADPPAAPRPAPRWYYNIWFVLLMLFFVLGPFGLPLVWKNPRFSRGVKWLLTLAVVALTWLAVDAAVKMARTILNEGRQLDLILPY